MLGLVMVNVYGTEGRLLEQLALNEELSVSELARASGLSYPTTFYKVSSFPFFTFKKDGREKKVKFKDEIADAVYPFLIALQTSRTKKVQLALALLSRKGYDDAVLGGELALQLQLYAKDAEPDPEIEIRARDPRRFRDRAHRLLPATVESELTSDTRIVEDGDISLSRRIGLVPVSRPEKLLVDAVAEKRSRVFVESIVEAVTNSSSDIDESILRSYGKSRGVLEEVLVELRAAKESGFP